MEFVVARCKQCPKSFKNFQALALHTKWKHENVKIHKCTVCDKIFKTPFKLNRHCSSVHKVLSCPLGSNKMTACRLCNYEDTRNRLKDHFLLEHNIQLESEILEFETLEHFFNWKEKTERETNAKYVKKWSPKKNKDGNVKSSYYCHRDGFVRESRSKGLRSRKLQGSNKINAYCPSAIELTEKKDNIVVKFTKTHIGHDNDVGRIGLTRLEKEKIAEKIAAKIPIDDILDELRDEMDHSNIHRLELSTRKDIHNIIQMFNLNDQAVLHKNDYVSVDSWVKQMKEQSNTVRLYKPQGYIDSINPCLEVEDFCLIIATDSQLEMLKKYGDDIICIDTIHGANSINSCDFELYTILVLDELKQACPCAFMISTRGDSVVMELYFREIISCLDVVIMPKWFMSDIAESFFNAWSTTCCGTTKHLYCSWHVDKAWRQNISKIKENMQQVETYKKLKTLLYETDIKAFNEMKNDFLVELYSKETTRPFAKYIEKFLNEPEKWAHCYILNTGINNNKSLENLHKELKYIYLKGKRGKRLDKGIHALMRFLRDGMSDRLIAMNRGKITQKLSALRACHKASLKLSESSVLQLSETKWNVVSSNFNDFYEVTKAEEVCDCKLRCSDCNACLHSFNCSCVDAAIQLNMCKHIHLVCRVIGHQSTLPEILSDDTVIWSIEISHEQEVSTSECLPVDLETRKSEELEKVKSILDSITTEEELEAFEKQIAPLQSILANVKENMVLEPLDSPGQSQEPTDDKMKIDTLSDPTDTDSLSLLMYMDAESES